LKNLKVERWNPSVKMFTVLLSVILLSFQYKIIVTLGVFLFSLIMMLFFSDARFKSIIKILIPATFAALGMFVMGLYYSKNNSITSMDVSDISSVPYALRAAMSTNLISASQLGSRILAYAGLGIFFSLTTDEEFFISSLMHQCHLSPKFAYGILAAVHLVPNLGKEYKNAVFAFRTRGIRVGVLSLKPVFAMLVNSIYWSENIAMAMQSKGFSDNESRTYYIEPKVGVYDILLSIAVLSLIVFGINSAPI